MSPEIEKLLALYADKERVAKQNLMLDRESERRRHAYEMTKESRARYWNELISDCDQRSASFLSMKLRELEGARHSKTLQ
jgi:hypothetical protein